MIRDWRKGRGQTFAQKEEITLTKKDPKIKEEKKKWERGLNDP